MAEITAFELIQEPGRQNPDINTIYYTVDYEPNIKGSTTDLTQGYYVRIEDNKIEISADTGWKQQQKFGEKDFIGYDRIVGGNGTTISKLKCKLTCEYREGEWEVVSKEEEILREGETPNKNEIPTDYKDAIEKINGEWVREFINVDKQYSEFNGVVNWTWQVKKITEIYEFQWGEGGKDEYELELDFYPHPAEFIFKNCAPGNQWKINEGINKKLITNLTDFRSYANQWCAWKNQQSFTGVPQFVSPLSASNLNAIYSALGHSRSYQTGDRVSADMFNGLANIINS